MEGMWVLSYTGSQLVNGFDLLIYGVFTGFNPERESNDE